MSDRDKMIAILRDVIDEAVGLLRQERPALALELLESVSQTLARGSKRDALPPGEGEPA